MELTYLLEAKNISETIKINESFSFYLYESLFGAYNALQNYEKSIEYLEKCKEIGNRTFKPEDPILISVYNNEGILKMNKGLYDEALKLFEKTYENIIKSDPNNRLIGYAMYNQGRAYAKLKNNEKALELLKKSLEFREKHDGKDSFETALSQREIGLVYFNIGDYHTSVKYVNDAVKVLSNYFKGIHPWIYEDYLLLSRAYVKLGKIQDGMNSFEIGLGMGLQAKSYEKMIEAYKEVGAAYKKSGRFNYLCEQIKSKEGENSEFLKNIDLINKSFI